MQHFPAYDWTLLSLPARYFNWRIRGNSLSWSFNNRGVLQNNYDLIIATSMTDLHGLFGFLPEMARTPSLLYFHENQFEYPLSENARDNVEPRLVPIYSALCATRVCFNSHYNFETFMLGLKQLLKKLPDHVPSDIENMIKSKSQILPVPIADNCFSTARENKKHFAIVWNHRWEYDKWPECFFSAMRILKDSGCHFKLHILGQQFDNIPDVFSDAASYFADEIIHWGRVDDEQAYRNVLRSAQAVVSTAIHDFQGIAVLEAVACGCIPVVPDRLAYRELFAEQYRYASCENDLPQQAEILANYLEKLYAKFQQKNLDSAPDISSLNWCKMTAEYNALFEQVLSG